MSEVLNQLTKLEGDLFDEIKYIDTNILALRQTRRKLSGLLRSMNPDKYKDEFSKKKKKK